MAGHWLNDFVEWTDFCECSERAMYWVGVWAIGGALRRKVWIDQIAFQWTPNFYLLIVGPPAVKKTTAIGLGKRFLEKVPGIDFGPQNMSWQQLITHMAAARQVFSINGAPFEASCSSIAISEFGTFFDPLNRELVDNLTDLWDSKIDVYRKETRTMGNDEVVNPFINIAAGTTPGWLSDNFSSKLLRSGFASRPIFLFEPFPKPEKDRAYPAQFVGCSNYVAMEASLMARLQGIGEYAGQYVMSQDAIKWGENWYAQYRHKQRSIGSEKEAAFYDRTQTHLHKLAMVISASRQEFPHITVEHLEEADAKLKDLEPDVRTIFGFVGQTRLSGASTEIADIMRRLKTSKKSTLYRQHFWRTMDQNEFEIAIKSSQAAGIVTLEGPMDDLTVRLNNAYM